MVTTKKVSHFKIYKAMKVNSDELQFIRDNAPTALPRLIIESLEAKGHKKLNRVSVHRELSTMKKEYNPIIIEEARRLIHLIKGVKYRNKVTNK